MGDEMVTAKQGDAKHVVVAMSGGVDSSVAAALLLEAGYSVTGMFLRFGGPGPQKHVGDARDVAAQLGIELVVVDEAEALDSVIAFFAAEYGRGRTPNPCVRCNATVKFRILSELADERGAGAISTGHYVRAIETEAGQQLARARSVAKDQSYALFLLPREYVERLVLPLGELKSKEEVRMKALELGLSVHDKEDSMEICFVPDDDYRRILRERAPEALCPGSIVRASGEVVGEHQGYACYTVGQRRGLGVAAPTPLYVTGIDAATATVTIGTKEEGLSAGLRARGTNWHVDTPDDFAAMVQIRYSHRGAPARVRRTEPDGFEVLFDEPIAAVAPGQAAVVYLEDRLLGGGWIDEPLPVGTK